MCIRHRFDAFFIYEIQERVVNRQVTFYLQLLEAQRNLFHFCLNTNSSVKHTNM